MAQAQRPDRRRTIRGARLDAHVDHAAAGIFEREFAIELCVRIGHHVGDRRALHDFAERRVRGRRRDDVHVRAGPREAVHGESEAHRWPLCGSSPRMKFGACTGRLENVQAAENCGPSMKRPWICT